MRRNLFFNTNKQIVGRIFFLSLFFAVFSCNSDKITSDSFYTFTGETVASFCEKNPECSIFSKIINETDTYSLLSTYGHYTCFAPTDSAFAIYFQEKGITYDDLTLDDKKTIVYNHVIKGIVTEYTSLLFQEGALPETSMNDRYIVISYGTSPGAQLIYVDKNSLIISKDNKVHNGIVHIVDRVVEPSVIYLDAVLQSHGNFSLFSKAFELTNMQDSIQLIYDETYHNPFPGGITYITDEGGTSQSYTVPDKKKYGYTVFAETDDVFKAAGIETLDQLVAFASKYYGTEDMDDYTSRNNPLNKFISYHILDRQMSTNSLVYSGPCTSPNAGDKKYEYYETMLYLRIMEIKSGNQINTQKDGSYVAIDESASNLDAINGFAHALKNILVYDENAMQNDVLNKRIRFDAYAIPPQLTNNNIRWQNMDNNRMSITTDYCEPYYVMNDASVLRMIASNYYHDYQADEILIYGWYDFTLRMPPVPPGTYEIRLGYMAESWRGIAQIFIDNQIIGIPKDLSKMGSSPDVGWVADAATSDNGVENDKMMRNLGYMKGPNSVFSLANGGENLRQVSQNLRIILGTFTFQDYAPHYFRVKNVEREMAPFHLDYLEYVPVSYLDIEGID